MPRKSVPCKRCGTLLFVGRGSRPDPTCRPCRALASDPYGPRRGGVEQLSTACKQCAGQFLAKETGQRFCSRACVSLSRRTADRPCEVCETPFWPADCDHKVCSLACAGKLLSQRAAAVRAARPPAPPKICSVCGAEMPRTKRAYCSYTCRVRSCGDRILDLYRLASQAGMAGAEWRKLLVGYLRERDGDRCQICREAIRYDLRSGPRGDPSGLGPSIDHVVPRSQDGGDELANLRLAHWRCNHERRAKGGNEQLLLIG